MVMGAETEYAIGVQWAGESVSQDVLLRRVQQHAFNTLGYSSTSTRGRFLTNAGLIYLDAGLHYEWSTPECSGPFDVVRYLAAGDRIMRDLLMSFKDAHPDVTSVFCSRTCVDYLSKTMWAAHESYQYSRALPQLATEMLPFLASRVILGAGGWHCDSPALRFTLSPRAHFITAVADRDSQHVRPLFHTKDEPLAPNSHRLHVACSESLCSQTANVLRFGTTALVLALVERGVAFSSAVTLDSPVHALHTFAGDPTLRATAQLARGGRTSALEIQRYYFESVSAYVSTLGLPWANDVCELWHDTLTQLEADPASAGTLLDWGIKRRLFERHLDRHGLSWKALADWDRVLTVLTRSWRHMGGAGFSLNLAQLQRPIPALRVHMDRLQPTLDRRGLSWDGIGALARARAELFELDAKFGALGDEGVFDALDAAGALEHRVMDFDVAHAVQHPPHDTRARLRGEVVRRLSESRSPYVAEWTRIYDKNHDRMLDLTDPFEQEERWLEHALVGEAPPLRGA